MLKPLFDNVAIKAIEAPEKTAGGIYLPENSKEQTQTGVVVAIGEGIDYLTTTTKPILNTSMKVKPNDKIIYKTWNATKIKNNDEDFTIINQKDILAIID